MQPFSLWIDHEVNNKKNKKHVTSIHAFHIIVCFFCVAPLWSFADLDPNYQSLVSLWKKMVMRGHVKSTMCCWQMASSQKLCETVGGKLCSPWKLSRNWAVKPCCSCGLWTMQPQRMRATSDKSLTTSLQEKMAPGVHATFLSEAADASHWFPGAHH